MTRTVAVVYAAYRVPLRTSLADHLFSFRRYGDWETIYVNAAVPGSGYLLRQLRPDAILFHTLLMDARFNPSLMARIEGRLRPLADLDVPKALLPQDEHYNSQYLCHFIERMGIDHVFSVSPPSEWGKLYGSLSPAPQIVEVLTGYIDPRSVRHVSKIARTTSRIRDIGYRVWRAEASLGRQGQLKVEVASQVLSRSNAHDLTVDVKTGSWGESLVGDRWWRFLLESRFVIGAEGGSSINDRDGTLRDEVRRYVAVHPTASFEEIESACFPSRDGELSFKMLSPRHLEACITRSGQALVEGGYNGVLIPGLHYLPIQPDFSNLDEVMESMKDETARIAMVDRAYRDIVESGRYEYGALVSTVLASLSPAKGASRSTNGLRERVAVAVFKPYERSWILTRTLVRALVLRSLAFAQLTKRALGQARLRIA
jgi:hypothetical protein